ncbi:flavin reductase family protein [Streptomyces sp. NPDC059009]|uniref:flavin reductase family protein n=1 Tax=Streptomyces sp. NPDC059009 TaxID=3346694 RepID=UPI0036C7A1E6
MSHGLLSTETTADLRSVMRRFPTGVALLSTGRGDEAVAMTINALMSVSLEPPRILVSVLDHARARPVLERTEEFTVNLLAGEQAELARLFASRTKPTGAGLTDHLQAMNRNGTDCTVLPGALATLSCSVEATYPVGDHSLFLGRVERVVAPADSSAPLLFHQGELAGMPALATTGTH